MKKIVLTFLCVLLMACSAQKTQTQIAADKAVEILDNYLNMDITASEAYNQIEELYNRVKALPVEDGSCDKTLLEIYLNGVSFQLSVIKNGGGIVVNYTDKDVIESKEKIMKACK